MAVTIHYRNAVLLIAGADITGDVTDLTINYSCETLDATTMGNTARLKKGGLFVAEVSGIVLFESGFGLSETVLWPLVDVNNTVVTVYPNGLTVGAYASPGAGFMNIGVLSQFTIGGKVGTLLPITFKVEGMAENT